MDIKIIVAYHKEYRVIKDSVYIPVHVGKKLSSAVLNYIGDDTGDNISEKNKHYCELTGLYWAWKNMDYEYLGTSHYRRYFKGKGKGSKWDKVLSGRELEDLCQRYDVILPRKRHYFIETNDQQYVHAHHKEDLEVTKQVLTEKYPEYMKAYEHQMNLRSGHRFNMFVMKKDLMDRYCTWLFDVLFEVEERLDISDYSDYDARVFGFLSERLLDVWVEKNGIRYCELPVMFMEKQNWLKKGFNFLKRKFTGGSL